MPGKQEIKFLDSFCADTSVVSAVIDRLLTDLNEAGYPKEEINEIILSMDESITNAIQETIKTNQKLQRDSCDDSKSPERRDVTIRYTITDDEFDATIIDHGKGLDIFNILHHVPDKSSETYKNEVLSYATESEKSKIKVRVNGQEIPLRGIGAGLKIILNFMDSITIDLIDKEKIIASSVTEFTDGTIFNMKRKKRY